MSVFLQASGTFMWGIVLLVVCIYAYMAFCEYLETNKVLKRDRDTCSAKNRKLDLILILHQEMGQAVWAELSNQERDRVIDIVRKYQEWIAHAEKAHRPYLTRDGKNRIVGVG